MFMFDQCVYVSLVSRPSTHMRILNFASSKLDFACGVRRPVIEAMFM